MTAPHAASLDAKAISEILPCMKLAFATIFNHAHIHLIGLASMQTFQGQEVDRDGFHDN